MAIDTASEQAAWLDYMQREKGMSREDALALEAEQRAALANASEGIRRWETREEFYALMGVECPPKPRALAGFKTAARAFEVGGRLAPGAAPAASVKPPRKRAASARVESLADARELARLRSDAAELADTKAANRGLARMVDAARDELAACKARVSQLEAELGERAPARDGMPSGEWSARVEWLEARERDLVAQVAGFLRWGVAS